MIERQCESCTACCQGWLVSDVTDMKPGQPCRHCTVSGCAIYETRPQEPCVVFRCGWLRSGSQLPPEMRPDRCGAIVLLGRPWQGWEIIRAVPVGDELPSETLQWLMSYARETKLPLMWFVRLREDGSYTGMKRMGYGPPAFRRTVECAIEPQDVYMA
jgi:hypothetical protein